MINIEHEMLMEAINAMATVQREKVLFLAGFDVSTVPSIEEYEKWIYNNLKTIVRNRKNKNNE